MQKRGMGGHASFDESIKPMEYGTRCAMRIYGGGIAGLEPGGHRWTWNELEQRSGVIACKVSLGSRCTILFADWRKRSIAVENTTRKQSI